MSSYCGPCIEDLKSCILDLNQPISKRTHSAFFLRTMGTPEAADVIATALKNREDSSLMRHELAYILGQMQHLSVAGVLLSILPDESEDILVRHEVSLFDFFDFLKFWMKSAEALGALGSPDFLEILQEYSSHSAPEIAETCQIAVDLINWKRNSQGVKSSSTYMSVDPAPPMSETSSVDELKSILVDTSRSLFDRYRAMFSLRDTNTDEAALALIEGFTDTSALFRHEVAYVLGQMQRPCTINGLVKVLRNMDEHEMVRHEAAEALGAIGNEECKEVLTCYEHDNATVVKESCVVALDNADYWAEYSTEAS